MMPQFSRNNRTLDGLGLLLAVGLMSQGVAHADQNDTFQPFVSLGYSHEDNLFLLPDSAPGFTGPRGDTVRQESAGLVVYKPLGRQIINLSAQASRVDYERYSQLNYTGKNASVDWEWHLANHLEGHVGGRYDQTLTSFADFHGQERSLRVGRRSFANGAWRFHPSWRLRTGFSRDKFDYDLQAQKVNDRQEDQSEVGIDYLAPSNSSIGVVARHTKGIVPNPQVLGGLLIENGYTQDEVKANIDWKFGGVTQFQLLAGWQRRQHASAAYRDASGLGGRGTLTWLPGGKLRFTASAWREFAAVESFLVTSSLNKGASLNSSYDLATKLRLQASVRAERRNFSQIAGVPYLGDGNDTTHTSSLGAVYSPWNAVQLNVSAQHITRSALQIAGSAGYRSNSLSASLVAQF